MIREEAFEDAFWRSFADDSIHSFDEPDSEEEAQAFAVAPWDRMSKAD